MQWIRHGAFAECRTSRSLTVVLLMVSLSCVSFGQDSPSSLLAAGRYEQALTVIEGALRSNPKDVRLWVAEGLAYRGLGRTRQSLGSFRHALELAPTLMPAIEGAAEAAFALRDSHADLYVKQILARDPGDATAHAMAGTLAFELKHCPDAIRHFKLASAVVDQNREALSQFGECLLETSQTSQAVAAFQRWVAAAPASREARYALAVSLQADGRPEEAATILGPLTEGSAADVASLNLLAALYLQRSKVQEAIDTLRRAVELAPTDERNYLDLAALCTDHNAPEIGLEVLNTGLRNVPGSARLLTMRGALQATMGRPEEAQKDFEEASRVQADSYYGTVGLSVLLAETDRLGEAESLLRKRLRSNPHDAVLNYLLADVLVRQGASPGTAAFSEARRVLDLAVHEQPGFAKAHVALGRLYLKEGAADAAVRELEMALRQDPRNPTALSQLMLALRKVGRMDEAGAVATRLNELLASQRKEEVERNRIHVTTADGDGER